MGIIDILSNLKVWIVFGFVAGILIGPVGGDYTSTIMLIVLILQMTVSFEGLEFVKNDFMKYKKPMILGMVCCFLVNSSITILMGSMFISVNTALWYGWVMLASVPSAVSVVSASLYLGGDTKATVFMTSAVYLSALIITPLISWIFIGSAIGPLEILKYILLFIGIPLIASRILKRHALPAKGRIIFINVMMGTLLFLALGSNRDYMFSQPDIILWVILVCLIRTFVMGALMTYMLKHRGVDRDMGMIYVLFSVWKNSGMATSLSMVLLSGMPEAAVPGAVSLIIETVWFSAFTSYGEKIWPHSETPKESLPS